MVRLLSLFPQTPSLHRNGWCWTPVSSSISEKTAVSKLHVYFQFRAYAHRRILEHHALWGKGQSSGVPCRLWTNISRCLWSRSGSYVSLIDTVIYLVVFRRLSIGNHSRGETHLCRVISGSDLSFTVEMQHGYAILWVLDSKKFAPAYWTFVIN